MGNLIQKIKSLFVKKPCRFTKEEAIEIARKYKLEKEVIEAMKYGYNPDEALEEWDIYPYNDLTNN